MKRYYRIFSGLLALSLLLSLFPLQGLAATAEDPQADEEVMVAESDTKTISTSTLITALGFCGENVTWVLDNDGILTISGTGPMDDYASKDNVPWAAYQLRISKVIIESGVTHVGSYAFYGANKLTSVTMTNDVCSIGQYAMAYCSILKDITLSESLTVINPYTFYCCKELTSISISVSGSVTTIGKSAFSGCSSLAEIQGMEGVNTIDAYAFSGCKSLTELTIGPNVREIGEYTFSECSSLAKIQGMEGVNTIDAYAFSGCKSLTELTIGPNVREIGEYAFSGCSRLVDLTIPDYVTSIGNAAFHSCSMLRNIHIFSNVASILKDVFSDCSSLMKITIASDVTSIGSAAFCNFPWLKEIVFEGSAPTFASDAFAGCSVRIYYPTEDPSWNSVVGNSFGGTAINWGAVVEVESTSGSCGENVTWSLNSEGTLTISGTGHIDGFDIFDEDFSWDSVPWFEQRDFILEIIIENGVTSIGQCVFSNCKNVTQITIPDSVTRIGSHAFYNCNRLTSISLPESCTSINDGTFAYCTKLSSIEIPSNVTYIGDLAFSYCPLSSIEIPEKVSYIGDSAFEGCRSLKNITIPDSVITIGEHAFYSCANLISVTMGGGISQIGRSAFAYCSNLQDVYIPDLSAWCAIYFSNRSSNPLYCGKNLYENDQLLVDLVIPEDVTTISPYAFYSCNGLESVSIPASVTTIRTNTFAECANLKTVNLPERLTSIREEAFLGCISLASIELPDSVIAIGKNAFQNCDSLQVVKISSIRAWCEIQFPNFAANPLNCGGSLYINEELVNNLVIPEDVTTISPYAFYNCDSLTDLTISNRTTGVGAYAFAYCDNLKNITLPERILSLSTGMFRGCSSLTQVAVPDSVVVIESYALGNCSSLESVYIPKSVKQINDDAFYKCTNLSAVHISDLKAWCEIYFPYMDTNPLYYARNIYLNGELISELEVPDDVTFIGKYAFIRCNSLLRVSVPESVTTIENGAFRNCKNLRVVVLPKELTKIGFDAFADCKKLWHTLYEGTEEQWSEITIYDNNTLLTDAVFHFSASGTDILSNLETCTHKEHFRCTICNAVVREKKVDGAHTYSSERDTTCDICGEVRKVAPAVPVIRISGVCSTGKNQITWEPAEGAVQYKVYRSTSEEGPYTQALTTGNLSYTHTSGEAGTRYYYYVVAVDAEGTTSGKSDILSRICDLPAPKIAVRNAESSGKIIVSWETVDSAIEYHVYRAASENGKYSLLTETTSTSFTDSTAKAGKNYYYKVKAIHSDSSSNSAYSNIKSRTCDLAQPKVTLSNVESSGNIKVSWGKIEGAKEYKVYRAATKSGKYKLMKTTTGTSYTNTSVDAGKTYYYKVVAVHANSAANSANSEIKSRTCDLPRPVVTASNVASSGKIKLTWKKVDGAVQYKVYRATTKSGKYKLMKTTTDTSYTNTSVDAGKTYYYKVVAVHDNKYANSAYSEIKSRTADLARPDVFISLSSGKPKVSWKKVDGAVKYEIYRATSKNGTYSLVKTTTGSYYKDTTSKSGKTYYYKVVAVCSNTAGNSAYSKVVSIKSTK